ncbi:MAG: hypothetical protein KDC03_05070 [Flavobacteriales bacterium]|nr:hypothetical protein [Flavobacteriales bacterium]
MVSLLTSSVVLDSSPSPLFIACNIIMITPPSSVHRLLSGLFSPMAGI